MDAVKGEFRGRVAEAFFQRLRHSILIQGANRCICRRQYALAIGTSNLKMSHKEIHFGNCNAAKIRAQRAMTERDSKTDPNSAKLRRKLSE